MKIESRERLSRRNQPLNKPERTLRCPTLDRGNNRLPPPPDDTSNDKHWHNPEEPDNLYIGICVLLNLAWQLGGVWFISDYVQTKLEPNEPYLAYAVSGLSWLTSCGILLHNKKQIGL